jgi:hypothetical protein
MLIVDVVAPPGFQLYVLPPPPVRVILLPLQISGLAGEIVAVGLGFTSTVTLAEEGQSPSALVTVRV